MTTAAFCAALMLSLPGAARGQSAAAFDESGRYLLIEKGRLEGLVFRLERGQWLTRQYEEMGAQLRRATQLNAAMEKEMRFQRDVIGELRSSLALADRRATEAESLIQSLKQDRADCDGIRAGSATVEREQEKEIESLRRRLAGLKVITGAVTAAGGVLLFLAVF